MNFITNSLEFEITRGNNDQAKIWEIVGLYLLHLINATCKDYSMGLYRNEGLVYYDTKHLLIWIYLERKFQEYWNLYGYKQI